MDYRSEFLNTLLDDLSDENRERLTRQLRKVSAEAFARRALAVPVDPETLDPL